MRSSSTLRYDWFRLSDDQLKEIRQSLYHSEGPGYYVFKGFLDDLHVQHVRQFWLHEAELSRTHVKTSLNNKAEVFYQGCPNYIYDSKYGRAYLNFFWNKPIDEVTHAAAWSVCMLRNQVESVNTFRDYFPIDGYQFSYRVVRTRNGEKIVAPHNDWMGEAHFNPARLQATLILSKKGVDYEGEGMWMMSNNDKQKLIFDTDIQVDPGDLVLWRYNNTHAVEDVRSTEDQAGFLRMIFPPEILNPIPKQHLYAKLGGKEMFRQAIRRFLKRMKP